MKSWIPILNFGGVPLVPLLNFESVLGSKCFNFRRILGPTFKIWEGSQVQSPNVPGPGVSVPILHHTIYSILLFHHHTVISHKKSGL